MAPFRVKGAAIALKIHLATNRLARFIGPGSVYTAYFKFAAIADKAVLSFTVKVVVIAYLLLICAGKKHYAGESNN